MPHIRAKQIDVAYPLRRSFGIGGSKSHQINALDGVSFEIENGDRVGLLGRNGAGKSTLLRTLAGIYPPQSGELSIEGEVASIFNASLGFIPQATGYENIFLRGAVLGMGFAEIERQVPYIEEFSELGDWLGQPVQNYSSGMALRLAFSITTAIRSDILLLDEWLGAGDAQFIAKARMRMNELIESAGILVLATHNLNLMRQVCNRAFLFESGRLVLAGTVEEVIAASKPGAKPALRVQAQTRRKPRVKE